MWTSNDLNYEDTLHNFRDLFNSNPRAKKLIKNWDRLILLSAADTGSQWALDVKNEEMVAVREMACAVDEEEEPVVHLQADESVLKDIFSGVYNPATALLDGALAVFSAERDKVKLEALAMVIWRLG